MVWFQCEVCGENLKKPKLPNHFRICSASKLSCIDCGQIFGQQTVQGHTQCITEAEKYGPKGQGRSSVASAKPKNDTKQKIDIDINVGLSERAPWFCSLCKTNATSKQTLFLHAEGKRHRAKARAFHAANQQPKQAESTPNSKILTVNNQNVELPGNVDIEQKDQNHPRVAQVHRSSEAGNRSLLPGKKRKLEESKNDVTGEKAGGDTSGELENEGVIQVEGAEKEETKNKLKKAKHSVTEKCYVMELNGAKEEAKKKIKWKKLIKSVLKSNPGGGLKLRKLRKHVSEVLRESGFTEDESLITDMLEQKINSSSKFTVDGKFVRLVAKS